MSTTISVRNGTAVNRISLCYTCRHAHIRIGFADSEEEVRCGFFYEEPHLVPFAVRECTGFLDKLAPTLYEMEKIAFVIDVKKGNPNAGFAGTTAKIATTVAEEKNE